MEYTKAYPLRTTQTRYDSIEKLAQERGVSVNKMINILLGLGLATYQDEIEETTTIVII